MAWNTFEKMLNDVDTFEGRDEGYKDRVNQAIKIGTILFHLAHTQVNVLNQLSTLRKKY